MAKPREPRSLFGEILDWMLAPLLMLWPMSVALTWVVAAAIANKPYDRELGQLAQNLAETAAARLAAGARSSAVLTLELERSAAVILRSSGGGEGALAVDEDGDVRPDPGGPDRRWIQILGTRGELLAGEARLPVPFDDGLQGGSVYIRDEQLGDDVVRVAAVRLRNAAVPSAGLMEAVVLVQVAETLGARSRLATEIIKGVILPQFAILPVAVLLVWFALSRGIRPLADLQARIRSRKSDDLSPIAEGNVPLEVAPLVRSVNDLLHRLDASMTAQRHFLADAAHQLKTPLAGLRTQAELAGRELDSGRIDAASLRHSLRQIAISSQRAAHMVNQLLAMARADDDGQKLRQQPLDLAAIVRAVVRDAVPRALERRLDLGYEGPESSATGRASVVGEPVLLGELVRNLVDNALQYTPAGGAITARILREGDFWVLQVEDNGPGVPEDERERVFQPFYRVLGTLVDGSGLGLAIVREIAERHGGTVVVTDAFPDAVAAAAGGVGALFTVRLPAASEPPPLLPMNRG